MGKYTCTYRGLKSFYSYNGLVNKLCIVYNLITYARKMMREFPADKNFSCGIIESDAGIPQSRTLARTLV